jgi:hypothetical protein
MAMFKCNACIQEYEDYYPPDDTCLKCKRGTIRIIPEYQPSEKLANLLIGMKVKLDCGHHCTIGHNLANTLIIYSLGGGRIETKCHNCGY